MRAPVTATTNSNLTLPMPCEIIPVTGDSLAGRGRVGKMEDGNMTKPLTLANLKRRNLEQAGRQAVADGDADRLIRVIDEMVSDPYRYQSIVEDCGDPAWARLASDNLNETEPIGGC